MASSLASESTRRSAASSPDWEDEYEADTGIIGSQLAILQAGSSVEAQLMQQLAAHSGHEAAQPAADKHAKAAASDSAALGIPTAVGVLPHMFGWHFNVDDGFTTVMDVHPGYYFPDKVSYLVPLAVFNTALAVYVIATIVAAILFVLLVDDWRDDLLDFIWENYRSSFIMMAVDYSVRFGLLRTIITDHQHMLWSRVFHLLDTAYLFYAAVFGIFVGMTRLAMSFVASLLVMARPDVRTFAAFKIFDVYHTAYVSTVLLDHRHNNPLLRCMCQSMLDTSHERVQELKAACVPFVRRLGMHESKGRDSKAPSGMTAPERTHGVEMSSMGAAILKGAGPGRRSGEAARLQQRERELPATHGPQSTVVNPLNRAVQDGEYGRDGTRPTDSSIPRGSRGGSDEVQNELYGASPVTTPGSNSSVGPDGVHAGLLRGGVAAGGLPVGEHVLEERPARLHAVCGVACLPIVDHVDDDEPLPAWIRKDDCTGRLCGGAPADAPEWFDGDRHTLVADASTGSFRHPWPQGTAPPRTAIEAVRAAYKPGGALRSLYIRFRWQLAYTLLNNPQLIELRKDGSLRRAVKRTPANASQRTGGVVQPSHGQLDRRELEERGGPAANSHPALQAPLSSRSRMDRVRGQLRGLVQQCDQPGPAAAASAAVRIGSLDASESPSNADSKEHASTSLGDLC